MLNRIILIGRLVADPQLRYTQSGIAVTSFTIAVIGLSPPKMVSGRQILLILSLGANWPKLVLIISIKAA